ncbi:MAG: oligosaccharide flippase family protein [Actinomycetota bacterium]|nr:oligosaccharide flippase family protein [Actinomycetota bacterium]
MRVREALAAARSVRVEYVAVPASQIAQLAAGFGLTLVLARELGPDEFGAFAFFIACLGVLGTFSELGFFSAASRLIAREGDEAAVRRVVGGGTVIAGVLAVAFAVLVAALSFVVDPIFDVGAGDAMLASAALCGGIALELVVLFLCQGTGRYRLLAGYNLVARPLPFAAVVLLAAFGEITLTAACVLYVLGPAVGAALVLRALRPDFTGARESIRTIRAERRASSDLGLWFGRALGTSTYNADRLLVAFFLTPADVSYYALAFALTMPIVVGAQSVTSVLYRRLVAMTAVPRRVLAGVGLWIAASGLAVAGVVLVVIHTVLDEYDPALDILVPAVATAMVLAAVQLPNWFLMAQGRGRILRDIAFAYTAANVLLKFTLTPAFGLQGAAYASLAAAGVSLGLHVVRYRGVTRELGAAEPAIAPPTREPLLTP